MKVGISSLQPAWVGRNAARAVRTATRESPKAGPQTEGEAPVGLQKEYEPNKCNFLLGTNEAD